MCEFEPPTTEWKRVVGLVVGRGRRNQTCETVCEGTCGGRAYGEYKKFGIMYLSWTIRNKEGSLERFGSGFLTFIPVAVLPLRTTWSAVAGTCRTFNVHDMGGEEGGERPFVLRVVATKRTCCLLNIEGNQGEDRCWLSGVSVHSNSPPDGHWGAEECRCKVRGDRLYHQHSSHFGLHHGRCGNGESHGADDFIVLTVERKR